MKERRLHAYAAGGVVLDGDKVLVLLRPSRNEVRLPKGHIERGETPEAAAVREVGEEGGYVDLELIAALGEQRVEFELPEDRIERDERYFLFKLVGHTTRPRNHQDRKFEPAWMTWAEAIAGMSYEPEREWIRRAAAAAGVNLA